MSDLRCPHCETEVDEHDANRCLDVWVAEAVMGLEPYQNKPDHWMGYDWSYPHLGTAKLVKKYSTQIAAAWEMVERFANQMTVQGPNSVDFNEGAKYPDSWLVGFGDDVWGYKTNGEADTFQLAICRTALKTAYFI